MVKVKVKSAEEAASEKVSPVEERDGDGPLPRRRRGETWDAIWTQALAVDEDDSKDQMSYDAALSAAQSRRHSR